jgi:hypothetical protein
MRLKVYTAVNMSKLVFWIVNPCGLGSTNISEEDTASSFSPEDTNILEEHTASIFRTDDRWSMFF